jgi:hypothetical protein
MTQLHKNPYVLIVLTAVVSVVTSLVNTHVIPADYGTPVLSAIGGLISGYGVVVVGSGSKSAPTAPVSVTSAPAATPVPGPLPVAPAVAPTVRNETQV